MLDVDITGRVGQLDLEARFNSRGIVPVPATGIVERMVTAELVPHLMGYIINVERISYRRTTPRNSSCFLIITTDNTKPG